MNATQFLKNAILLITALTLFGIKLAAQDKITFTWQYPNPHQIGKSDVGIKTTPDKSFSVNWGDGSPNETKIGSNSIVVLTHSYEYSGEYQVTIFANDYDCRFLWFISYFQAITNLSLAGCSALEEITCYENKLKNLDLNGCSKLQKAFCNYNKLQHIDLNNCKSLNRISCNNNCLQLSYLFAISSLVDDDPYKRWLGDQNLPPKFVVIDTELFADQSVYNGIFTNYSVLKEDAPVSADDFSVVDGKITFHTIGKYDVVMTNDAIASPEDIPMVYVTLNVSNVGILENNSLNISVYPNPTDGELIIINEQLIINNVEVYDINGKKLISYPMSHISNLMSLDISHLPAGIYCLKINGQTVKIIKK